MIVVGSIRVGWWPRSDIVARGPGSWLMVAMVDTKTRSWSETCACSWRPECLHFQPAYSWSLSRSYCSPPLWFSSTYDNLLSLKWFSHVTASTRGWRTAAPPPLERMSIFFVLQSLRPLPHILKFIYFAIVFSCWPRIVLAPIHSFITLAFRVQEFRI